MKKTTVLILSIICGATITFAQNYPSKSLEEFHFSVLTEKSRMGGQYDYSSIQGSPFLNNEFVKGEVTSTSNTIVSDVPLRYNIYADEIEYEEKDKKTFYLDKSTVKNIKIGGSEFIYKAYLLNNKLGRSYFEVLLRGKATLLKQYRVNFEDAKPAKAYEDPSPARFKTSKPDFYIAFGDAEAKRISGAKQLSEELFSDKGTEIAGFIKKNKLKTGDQEDIVRIVQFYNEGQ
ncbi:MAG: hypothetical protein RBS73_07655 [Prolixibacteraceae bacterium]|jgi:hypothetical protein|nr:hypothetical protein [Prolixibacteraceae bacterium]